LIGFANLPTNFFSEPKDSAIKIEKYLFTWLFKIYYFSFMEPSFINILFIAALSGYKEDANPFNALSHETWDNVMLWATIKDLQHGPFQRTRLMYAAKTGNVQRVKWLLARGALLDLRSIGGMSALDHGCREGKLEVVQELVAHGAAINPVVNNKPPLWYACMHPTSDVALWLIQQGADVSKVCIYEESESTALHTACCGGCINVVEALLVNGAPVNLGVYTPLYVASQNGYLEIVRMLLKWGAKATENDLLIALQMRRLDVAHELIAQGFTVKDELRRKVLISASTAGSLETVRLMLDSGEKADRRLYDPDGSPLYLASAEGHLSIVIELLARGALVNRGKWVGPPADYTPLDVARKNNHIDVVAYLIEKGGVSYGAHEPY
jgi:ankyrin repeat protein